MPFKKGQSGNPSGRPKKPAVEPTVTGDKNQDALNALETIFSNTKLAPTARVSAIREYLNRAEGLPNKAKQTGNEIDGPTARKLVELAELALQTREIPCPHCRRYFIIDGLNAQVEEPKRVEKPREPLVEPQYTPPLPQAIVDAQNEEDRQRMTTVLVKP